VQRQLSTLTFDQEFPSIGKGTFEDFCWSIV